MQKYLEKLHKNKKGFTLVELLVTVLLLSLVLGLTLQVSHAFYHRYRMVEARWRSQNAARRVMEYFEIRSEALNNSAMISLFKSNDPQPPLHHAAYDNTLDATVMQGVPDTGNDSYAYIYTQNPNPTDPAQGNLIYVLERGTGKTPISLTQYILKEDVPLDIHFQVSATPVKVQKSDTEDGPVYTYGTEEKDYLNTTVDIEITTPASVGGNYKLKTSFTMNNMLTGQKLNFEGANGAPTPTPASNTQIGIAGWSNADLNAKGKCPIDPVQYPFAQQKANILRYMSVQSFLDSSNMNGDNINIQKGGCFGTLSMQGSAIENQVLNSLRDFRDNVLSKTTLGNKIIDKYYNVWSPALLNMAKENPEILKVSKCILVPASLVALLVAD